MAGSHETTSGQRRSASAELIAERIPNAPGDVVRGRDDAATLRIAADDERSRAERGLLQLLDRGEERIQVDVGEYRHLPNATVPP